MAAVHHIKQIKIPTYYKQGNKHSNVVFIISSTRSQEMNENMPMDMSKGETGRDSPRVCQS